MGLPFPRMKIKIEIQWNEKTSTLSGNPGAERLMVDHPLPDGFHWLVVEIKGRYWWDWHRKVKVRKTGKCQVYSHGAANIPAELVRGKTSDGCPVDFVLARQTYLPHEGEVEFHPRRMPIPFEIRPDRLKEDAAAFGIPRRTSPQDVARQLGWWEEIHGGRWDHHPAKVAAERLASFIDTPVQWQWERLRPYVQTVEPGFE